MTTKTLQDLRGRIGLVIQDNTTASEAVADDIAGQILDAVQTDLGPDDPKAIMRLIVAAKGLLEWGAQTGGWDDLRAAINEIEAAGDTPPAGRGRPRDLDKRRHISQLASVNPTLSMAAIARHVGCSEALVAKVYRR